MSLRKPNKRILILCEGVTEQLYATSLRSDLPRSQQRSISVDIVKGGEQNPLQLFKEAMAKRKRRKKRILTIRSGCFLIMTIGRSFRQPCTKWKRRDLN